MAEPSPPDAPGGLGLGELKLVTPHPGWVRRFEVEAARLRLLPGVQEVQHIGSTAIPGILAKPVIDVALAVAGAPDDPALHHALAGLGYECHGEYGLPGRQFFTLGQPPFLHVHAVTAGSPHWRDWLAFRDYLRAHPEWARRYEEEKRRLLDEAGGDRSRYTRQKGAFVRQVLDQARRENGTSGSG